ERRARVEQVGPALLVPAAGLLHRHDHREQVRDAVGDGRVDHLSLPLAARMCERRENPGDEVERTATEVAEQIDRHLRWPTRAPDGIQAAGDADVVDVVAGGVGEWTVLPPSRHPAIDEPRIALMTGQRTEAETLRHTRPETL